MFEKIKSKIKNGYKRAIRTVFPHSKQRYLYEWKKINGDKTLRLQYPLNKQSIVFDIGGFKGEWSHDIYSLYTPTIYIFEPIPEFAQKITQRFQNNPSIHVIGSGIGNKNEKKNISFSQDGSSAYMPAESKIIEVDFVDIMDMIEKYNIPHINLMKMNIEGGEYELLQRLTETGYVKNISDIQIQFHDFKTIPRAKVMREEIRKELAKTHTPTYDYPFVWENWRLKK